MGGGFGGRHRVRIRINDAWLSSRRAVAVSSWTRVVGLIYWPPGLAGPDLAGARCAGRHDLFDPQSRQGSEMNLTRSFAAAATFAAVAVGAAAPASAAPVMSGHYIKTTTYPAGGGRTFTEHWYFTPCGDGCADMSSPATGGGARAMLVNGQWTIDSTDDIVCKDGITEGNAANTHYTWDPNTLAGTVQVIQKQAVCDHAPQSYTLSVQLTKAVQRHGQTVNPGALGKCGIAPQAGTDGRVTLTPRAAPPRSNANWCAAVAGSADRPSAAATAAWRATMSE